MSKQFDPSVFPPLAEHISVMPEHSGGWSAKLANWWAGATIASPTMEVAAPAVQCIKAVRRLMGEDIDGLNQYYVEQTQWARGWVRKVLDLPKSTPVLLDASGTIALLTATRIFGQIAAGAGATTFFTITTDEGGSLVPATLRGFDPNQMERTMFQPNTGLFYEPQPVLPYPEGLKIESKIVGLAKLDNDALVAELRRLALEHLAAGRNFGCLVLPHVVKSGRILPLHAVSQMILELRPLGLNLYLIVDDIQGFGRVPAELIARPIGYCDAYVIGSAKALGGLLTASAVVIQPVAMERFLDLAEAGKVAQSPCISHFQFEPQQEARLPEAMIKSGAVSLPEIVSMATAMYWHFFRGQGEDYLERRHNQLRLVEIQRAQLVGALTANVPGIKVLQPTPDRPLVPSIVSFEAPRGISPGALKDALQGGTPIVTPCAPIGRYLRLDIPEYRDMPSVPVLIARLQAAIQELQSTQLEAVAEAPLSEPEAAPDAEKEPGTQDAADLDVPRPQLD